jgi:putative transcriptional regulator
MLSMLDNMQSLLYILFVHQRPDIRNLVKRHRLVAGMTQQQLADRVGVTRQTVLSIEKGKYTPSVALALCLAEVLEVSVEILFQLDKGENDG